MGTSIISPGLGQPNAAFNWNNIYSMFGPASPARSSSGGGLGNLSSLLGNTGVGNLLGTPNNNPGNVNQFYPIQSLLQTTAPNLVSSGGNIVNAGLNTSLQALQTLMGPEAFSQALLSANPTTVTGALAPMAANVANMTAGATNQISEGTPYGAWRSTQLANEPFAQAGALTNAAYGLQNQAVQNLLNIGQEQGAIGQGIAGTGTGLTSQGLQALVAAMQGANQKQQINQQAGSVFGDIMQALGAAGGVASGVGGILSGIGMNNLANSFANQGIVRV